MPPGRTAPPNPSPAGRDSCMPFTVIDRHEQWIKVRQTGTGYTRWVEVERYRRSPATAFYDADVHFDPRGDKKERGAQVHACVGCGWRASFLPGWMVTCPKCGGTSFKRT